MAEFPDISDDEARYLNRMFYEQDPGHYIHLRLMNLIALGSDPEEFAARFDGSGLSYGRVHVAATGQDFITDVDAYLAVESQLLLHHAAEAVIRSFLAHSSDSPCPWLEISRRENFARLTARVRELVAISNQRVLAEAVDRALIAGTPPPDLGPDEVDQIRRNLATLIRRLAAVWLDESNLYNAGKHGSVAFPTNAEFVVEMEPGSGVGQRLGFGRSVTYLAFEDGTWSEVTRWVDVDEALCLIQVCDELLRSVWSVGRARHAPQPGDTIAVLNVTGETPPSYRSPDRPSVRQWARHLSLREAESADPG